MKRATGNLKLETGARAHLPDFSVYLCVACKSRCCLDVGCKDHLRSTLCPRCAAPLCSSCSAVAESCPTCQAPLLATMEVPL